jgi:hypothetical protein
VIKVRHSTTPIKSFIASEFVGSVLDEEHHGYLHFRLPMSSIQSMPAIFAVLERAKTVYDLEDYELTQTSLESIFCKFAQAQYDTEENPNPKPTRRAHVAEPETATTALNRSTSDDDDDDDDALCLLDNVPRQISLELPSNIVDQSLRVVQPIVSYTPADDFA